MFDLIKKLFYLINARDYVKLSVVLFLMLISSVTETLGVAAIIPFLESLTVNDNNTNFFISFILTNFNIELESLTAVLAFVLIILLTASVIIKITSLYAQNYFCLNQEYKISRRLFSIVLQNNRILIGKKTSSETLTEVLSETNNLIFRALLPAVTMIANILTSVLLLGLIAYLNPPVTALLCAIFGVSYLFIYLFTQNKINRNGYQRLQMNTLRYKVVTEALQNIKFVKLSDSQNLFLRRYDEAALPYAKLQANFQGFIQSPRYLIEYIGFCVILTIILWSIYNNSDIATVAGNLIVFAVVGYKLLPAVQQIFGGFANIRFSAPTIDLIFQQFQQDNVAGGSVFPMALEKVNMVRIVTSKFQFTNGPALIRDIDLQFKSGLMYCVVGKNGSGKSTLLNLLMGLYGEVEGTDLYVDGNLLRTSQLSSYRRLIGLVPQEVALLDADIYENISFGKKVTQHDKRHIEHLATLCELDTLINSLPDRFYTIVGENGKTLSGGRRQLVGIARSLFQNPKLLILDEATSALDVPTEKRILSKIRAKYPNIIIVSVAHRRLSVEASDVLILLEDGLVVSQGVTANLLESDQRLRDLVGYKSNLK